MWRAGLTPAHLRRFYREKKKTAADAANTGDGKQTQAVNQTN